jgi:hypothetical protein
MSIVPTDLDLTAIVASAAEVTWDSATNGAHGTWDSVPRQDQAKLKEAILPTVLGTIAAVREQLATKVEAIEETDNGTVLVETVVQVVRGPA